VDQESVPSYELATQQKRARSTLRSMCIYNILGVKRNPLFLHEIEWKNNGFLFTTPNIYIYIYI